MFTLFRSFFGAIHNLFRKRNLEQRLQDELQLHIDLLAKKYEDLGVNPEEAQRQARIAIGGFDQTMENVRDARGIRWFDELRQDFRITLRTVYNNRRFSAIIILTLALGIGVNTALFSLINNVLFRPVAGLSEQDRLVQIGKDTGGGYFPMVSYPNYRDWRDMNHVFSHMAAYANLFELSLDAEDMSDYIQGLMVSANYFNTLGVKFALGRGFLDEDDLKPGAQPVAVLNYSLWQGCFAGDPNIIGKTIDLNRYPFTIIGVAGKGFKGNRLDSDIGIWVPITMITAFRPEGAGILTNRNYSFIEVVGRLKTGINLQQAKANMNVIARSLEKTWPNENINLGISLKGNVGLQPLRRQEIVSRSALLATVVVLVLMIACFNVANLLLARTAARKKEIAIRLALGVGRARLVRQLLVEYVFLALAGGIIGVLAAYCTKGIFSRIAIKTHFFPETDYPIDFNVLCFAVALSLLTGLAVGLIPALQSSRTDPMSVFGKSVPLRSLRFGPRNGLVVSQIAISLVLLVVAGVMIRALWDFLNINPGFNTKNILCASLDLDRDGIREPRQRQLLIDIVERVRALPGVQSASLAGAAPTDASMWTTVTDYNRGQIDLSVGLTFVDPDYFNILGIPFLGGRNFIRNEEDSGNAIINKMTAQTLWPGENPIGKKLVTSMGQKKGSPGQAFDVIGVTNDIRRNLADEPEMWMYLPRQYQGPMALFVRSDIDPAILIPQLRLNINTLDKSVTLFNMERLSDQVRNTLSRLDSASTMMGFFALLALVLTGMGIYGLISYRVTLQTHNIGIRIALGARRQHILGLVISRGMILAIVGLAIGAVGGFYVLRLLSHTFLAGLHEVDLATFSAVIFLLLSIAFLAVYIPARRAVRIDPLTTIREE